MFLLKDTELAAGLAKVKRAAILGAVDKPGRASDMVGRYLMDVGVAVVPVHPKRRVVWDLPAFSDLGAVPGPLDAVVLFRNAAFCPDHAREFLQLAPTPAFFWMQSGIVSPEAVEILEGCGTMVVQDRCIMVEHKRLLGDA